MTSPPSMPHPSPSGGGLMPASPLNPQPSPMAAHSPGPNLAYMQNHPDSSPFNVLSPAAAGSNWPGSPGMPRPSPRPGQSPEHKSQGKHIRKVLNKIRLWFFFSSTTRFACITSSIMGWSCTNFTYGRSPGYPLSSLHTPTERYSWPRLMST